MNIFYLDNNPKVCAEYHVNSHCVKMILESAQLLSTAHYILDGSKPGLYKPTHVNHPCAKWVRESESNYIWLFDLLVCLLNEYTYRYGKIHKTSQMIEFLIKPPFNIPKIGFTKPPSAMPDEYKISENPVDNYKSYYKLGKKHLHIWKNRKKT